MAAIPTGMAGWREDLPQPTIMTRPLTVPSQSPGLKQTTLSNGTIFSTSRMISTSFATPDGGEPNSDLWSTSLTASVSSVYDEDVALQQVQIPKTVLETPILIDTLPRDPPIAFVPRPPSASMSHRAKLECLYRWTLFSPEGRLFLAQEPREKKFIMNWADAEVEEADLVKWTQDMWWPVWARQFRTNYVGMWKKRMEKEDKNAEAKKLEEKKKTTEQSEANENMGKLMNRLVAINTGIEGLVDEDAPEPVTFEGISCGC